MMRNGWFGRLLDEMARRRMLWLFLMLAGVMSVCDLTGAVMFDAGSVVKALYVVFVAMLKATVLTLLYCLCLRKTFLRMACIALIVVYAALALVNFTSFQLYGFGITRKLILILAQTTPQETSGFLPGLLQNMAMVFGSWRFYAVSGLIVLLAVIAVRIRRKAFLALSLCGSAIGCVGFVCFCVSYPSGRSAHSLIARTVKYGNEVRMWNRKYQELASHKRPLPDAASVASDHLAATVTVVIGESAARRHHSLYGYPLATTPGLDSLADSLFVFTDAISSSKATSGNMERILSFKEDDSTDGDGLDYPLLIDCFKAAGYKTFWLSNQERVGSVSNTSGVMAMNSDVIEYAGAENSEDALCVKFDGILMPYLDDALKDTAENRLIFLHFLGSHVEYKSRYPASYGFFDADSELKVFRNAWLDREKAQRRAEYDNSIRYTDSLLTEIIRKTAALEGPAVVIYLSDHGESVYEESSFSGRDEACAEVPFFIYANAAYRRLNPEIITRMESALSRPFSTANLVHLLLTLTGSRYSRYEPRLDILSPGYEIRPRYVDERIWPLEHIGE